MRSIITIPARRDFLHQLACGLLYGDSMLSAICDVPLCEVVVLLPTRRACFQLTETLLQEKKALLLPTIAPLGDIDEAFDENLWMSDPDDKNDHAVIDPVERHLVLTRLIRESRFLDQAPPSTIANLAQALAYFIDLTDRFEADRTKLASLAPERFAEHWQRALKLLNNITETWTNYLANRKKNNPVEHRNQQLRHFADQLDRFGKPLVIAGSTGSQPATAYLLNKTACYRQGMVILPALDLAMEDKDWEHLTPTHPQYGLKNLLEHIGVKRDQIALWDNKPKARAREKLIRALFSPSTNKITAKETKIALKNISLVEAHHKREEAAIIALILRESLEKKNQKAALITPDRDLARRVSLHLTRWMTGIDDEAGIELTTLPCFIFLKLVAEMVVSDWTLLSFLSCLKHPLALAGKAPGMLRRQIHTIEYLIRKDSNPWHMQQHIQQAKEHIKDKTSLSVLDELETMFKPLTKLTKKHKINFSSFLKAHIACAEALGASDEHSSTQLLWAHNEGTEKIAHHLRALIEHADCLGEISLSDYPQLFENLFATAPNAHPASSIGARLHIWSPMEARLQNVDLAILGGLNEGIWPTHSAADPWLNRAMRTELGLEPPEAQIGQSAHDFTQGLAATKVVLTRAMKGGDGSPLQASPWLLRMENLLKGMEQEFLSHDFQSILSSLDRSKLQAQTKSLPQPPLDVRPKKLSASALTSLLTDPYAFYVERILKIKPLTPLEEEPSAAERGHLIHAILHSFIQKYKNTLPEHASDRLIALGKEFFEKNTHAMVHNFWWPRFVDMAAQFIALEQNSLRKDRVNIFTEINGAIDWMIGEHKITLTARADRIDISKQGAAIYDYKTGMVPRPSHIPERAPQLPLEAMILKNGGFEQAPNADIWRLAYIQLKERSASKMLIEIKSPNLKIQETEVLLKTLLTDYLRPDQSFPAVKKPMVGDYDHLARIKTQEKISK